MRQQDQNFLKDFLIVKYICKKLIQDLIFLTELKITILQSHFYIMQNLLNNICIYVKIYLDEIYWLILNKFCALNYNVT